MPGEITILKPGKDHPQGEGATRSVAAGSMNITEDIVGFRSPEYFSYATHNGGLPVNDFAGEMFFEQHKGGLLAKYKGGFLILNTLAPVGSLRLFSAQHRCRLFESSEKPIRVTINKWVLSKLNQNNSFWLNWL